MKTEIIAGVLGALGTGVAIGIQSTLSSRTGSLIGDVNTGFITNIIGGIAAGILLLLVTVRKGSGLPDVPGKAILMLTAAGLLGILIITGISFSLKRAGVAAGLATVILGQMAISAIVDTVGAGGVDPIPLSLQRMIGLALMAASVYFLVPKS